MTALFIILGIIIIAIVIAFFWNYQDKYIRYCCVSKNCQYTCLDFKTLKSLVEVNRSIGKSNWHYEGEYFTIYYLEELDFTKKYVIVPQSDWRAYKKYINSLIQEDAKIKEEKEKRRQREIALSLMEAGQKDIDTLKGIINEDLKKVEETTKRVSKNLQLCATDSSGLKIWADTQTGRFYTFNAEGEELELGWGWMP